MQDLDFLYNPYLVAFMAVAVAGMSFWYERVANRNAPIILVLLRSVSYAFVLIGGAYMSAPKQAIPGWIRWYCGSWLYVFTVFGIALPVSYRLRRLRNDSTRSLERSCVSSNRANVE